MHTTLPGRGSQAFKTRPRLTLSRAGGVRLRPSFLTLFEHESNVGLQVESRGRHLERELRNVMVGCSKELVPGHDHADVALFLEPHGDQSEYLNRAEFAHFKDALFHLFVGRRLIKPKGLDGRPGEVPPFAVMKGLVERLEASLGTGEVSLIPDLGSLASPLLRKAKLPKS